MRNIPEDNLAYPSLLTWAHGATGSGFQLNTGDAIYFVTAKHVLFDDKGSILGKTATLACQMRSIEDETSSIFTIDFDQLSSAGNLHCHNTADVAAFKLLSVEPQEEGGGYKLSTAVGIAVNTLGDSGIVSVNAHTTVLMLKDVLISNDVFVYGYPISLGLRQSPQFDYNKPLLRKGIIANVYKKHGTIILDCPIYYGNSGGPVVQVEQDGFTFTHKVIGVVSQFVPYTEEWINLSNRISHLEVSNSGYSVAVSMDYVFAMLGLTMTVVGEGTI